MTAIQQRGMQLVNIQCYDAVYWLFIILARGMTSDRIHTIQ